MNEDLNSIILGLKDDFLELIPNLLTSLVVLALGYGLARLLKYLVVRLINYISQLLSIRFGQVNLTQAARFVGIAVFWLIIFCTALLITNILGLTILTTGFSSILQYLPNVLAAILIIFAATILGNFVTGMIGSVATRMGLGYGNTLGRIAYFLIVFTAIIIAIDQIGIEVTILINIIDIILAALLFGAALAFGLGARTSVSNILATFYIRKMYKVGDYIQIGDIKGTISRIDATNVLLDYDGGQVNIPAKDFNETRSFLINRK